MSVFCVQVIYCTVRGNDRKSHLYTLSVDTSVFFRNICDHQWIESMVMELQCKGTNMDSNVKKIQNHALKGTQL